MKKGLSLWPFGIIITIIIGLVVVLALTEMGSNFFKNTTNEILDILGIGEKKASEEIIKSECQSRCTICCETREDKSPCENLPCEVEFSCKCTG